jgi:hypothetical protein
MSDVAVAVNLGGNCGGVLYCAGAMVEVSSGRGAEVEKGSFRWLRTEGARAPKRREARMAAMKVKRATETKKILEKRELAASVPVGGERLARIGSD